MKKITAWIPEAGTRATLPIIQFTCWLAIKENDDVRLYYVGMYRCEEFKIQLAIIDKYLGHDPAKVKDFKVSLSSMAAVVYAKTNG